METMGAREFRHRLDQMLRKPSAPCRIMLHNKPALAVMSDDYFLQIMEIFEELKNKGVLKKVSQKLAVEEKKNHAWFWSKAWQKKERQADKEIKSGKKQRVSSAGNFIKALNL